MLTITHTANHRDYVSPAIGKIINWPQGGDPACEWSTLSLRAHQRLLSLQVSPGDIIDYTHNKARSLPTDGVLSGHDYYLVGDNGTLSPLTAADALAKAQGRA